LNFLIQSEFLCPTEAFPESKASLLLSNEQNDERSVATEVQSGLQSWKQNKNAKRNSEIKNWMDCLIFARPDEHGFVSVSKLTGSDGPRLIYGRNISNFEERDY
jgi:hypothetical protein